MKDAQVRATDKFFAQVDAALREYCYRVGLPVGSFLSVKLEEDVARGRDAFKLRLRFERGFTRETWGKDILRSRAELTGNAPLRVVGGTNAS